MLTKPADPMIYLAASHVSAAIQAPSYGRSCACDLPDPAGYCPDARSSVLAGSGSFGSIFDTGGGLCIYSGSCLLDWESEGLYRLLYKNLTEFIQYPFACLSPGIRELLTFVLPYAFINYYPVQYFIDRQEGICPGILRYLTPLRLRCVFAFQAVLAAGSAGLQRGRLIIKTERGENRMAYIEAENL
ncbi:MAG: ABC-2 family transporter protein [Clostridium sp.]